MELELHRSTVAWPQIPALASGKAREYNLRGPSDFSYNTRMEQTPNPAALTNDQTPSAHPATPTPQPVSAIAVPDALPPAGTPPCDLLELSTSQVKALEALTAGHSIADAARGAGVHPGTLHRWKKTDPRFIVALNAWRIEALASARDRVLALTDEATRAAYRLLRKDNPSVTIAILKSLGSLGDTPPGTTDIDEAAANLRQEQRKRDDARKSRLRDDPTPSATMRRRPFGDEEPTRDDWKRPAPWPSSNPNR